MISSTMCLYNTGALPVVFTRNANSPIKYCYEVATFTSPSFAYASPYSLHLVSSFGGCGGFSNCVLRYSKHEKKMAFVTPDFAAATQNPLYMFRLKNSIFGTLIDPRA